MIVQTPARVQLQIPARPEFLRPVRMLLAAIASQMDFDYDAIEDLKLAIGEACTNAIRHGSVLGETMMTVACVLDDDALVIEVRDEGRGPEPGEPEETDDALERAGLGLLVMQSVMDEVTLEALPTGGHAIRMVKRRC